MMDTFCLATFVYGERYYPVANRFIDDIAKSGFQPTLVVVTDKPDKIRKEIFVKTLDIREFNDSYVKYETNYYGFDFSVQRFSIQAALQFGFTKIVMTNADMRVGSRFTHHDIFACFSDNAILGPNTFNYHEQTISLLGVRLVEYEKHFNVPMDKDKLKEMPEDCIMFLSMPTEKYQSFLDDWDKCVQYKNEKRLQNTPVASIDEICFSAVKNEILLSGNRNRFNGTMYPDHDRWYA